MSDSLQLLRQWKLLQRLSDEQDGVLLTQLSSELGVSARTVRRDLGVLQAAGFPLDERLGERARLRLRRPFRMADAVKIEPDIQFIEPMNYT